MDKYYLAPTEWTPEILLDYDAGFLEIKGRSVPENADIIFKEMLDWVDRYTENPAPTTRVSLAVEYINSATTRTLIDFFKKLKALNKAEKTKMTVEWMYEEDDTDMLDLGKDFQELLDIPTDFIAVERLNSFK